MKGMDAALVLPPTRPAGIHYPTDVAGSALLALGLDAVAWVTTQPVRSWLNLHCWDGPRLRSLHGARRR